MAEDRKMIETIKTCTKCKQVKNLSDFGRHETCKNGIRSICKVCHNKDAKKWSMTNLDRKRELDRIWRSKNIDKVRKSRRKSCAKIRSTARDNRIKKARIDKPFQPSLSITDIREVIIV